MGDIYFYSRGTAYGWLSNFERAKQIIDGIEYPTNEHYYQSEKANNADSKAWIIQAPSPYLAMKAGRNLRRKEFVINWDTIKIDIMFKGLMAKFTQNPILKRKLLNTGDAVLHENSPTDMFWGVKGKDMLGRLLMKVRNKLKNDLLNDMCNEDMELYKI